MDEEELSSVKPYKTLGITKSATADEIKSAYRKAALKHHPGTSSPSLAFFLDILI